MELTDIQVYEYMEICLKNSLTWYIAEIMEATQKTVTVTLPKGMKRFFVTDEVKCRISDGKNTFIFDSEICDVIFKNPQALVLFVPGQIKRFDEFRKEKRYSTNLLAEAYKLKKIYGYVNDLSRRGLCFQSKGYLEKGDEIGIKLYYEGGNQWVYFEGIVVRKEEVGDAREYGIEIENIKYEEEDKYFKLVEELERLALGGQETNQRKAVKDEGSQESSAV